MSNKSAQEKTEQATPKRLADARKKGQVPRSRELTTAAVTLSAAAALMVFGESMAAGITAIFNEQLTLERALIFDPQAPVKAFHAAIASGLTLLAPYFAVVIVAAIAAPALTGGWSFSLQAIAPKAEKLNPFTGIKRVFGPRGLMELAKALAKFGLVGSVAVLFLRHLSNDYLALGTQPVLSGLASAAELGITALIVFAAPLLIIAAVDVPFQLWDHAKQLRMTRQEVRDEAKETDGNPELKQRVRAMQQEQANRRMMEEVPKADVVITNPTHFAVALKYDPDTMAAPRVVAKGADLLAARIRELATDSGVPLMAAPPLARAIYRGTDLNQEIPAQLYAAVAQVLSYVFQLRQARRYGGVEPTPPDVDFEDEDDQ